MMSSGLFGVGRDDPALRETAGAALLLCKAGSAGTSGWFYSAEIRK